MISMHPSLIEVGYSFQPSHVRVQLHHHVAHQQPFPFISQGSLRFLANSKATHPSIIISYPAVQKAKTLREPPYPYPGLGPTPATTCKHRDIGHPHEQTGPFAEVQETKPADSQQDALAAYPLYCASSLLVVELSAPEESMKISAPLYRFFF